MNMKQINQRLHFMDAVPFRTIYVEGGERVDSYALRDIDVDALFDLPDLETVYRARLGDMSFVTRQSQDGHVSHLYFASEYPNNKLGLLERATTYYATPIFGSEAPLCELRANDPRLRIIDWDAGVAMARRFIETSDPNIKRTIERILEVDQMLKQHGSPAVSQDEMRQSVGLASGARISASPFLLGDVGIGR
jgi:hypothetical protein